MDPFRRNERVTIGGITIGESVSIATGRPIPLNTFYGDVYNHTTNQIADDDENDEWIEKAELPPDSTKAESDERDYYVDTIAETTTWVKPVPNLVIADAGLWEKLREELSEIVQPDIKIMSSIGSSGGTAGNEPTFVEIVKDQAKEAGVKWPNRGKTTPQEGMRCRCSIFTKGASIPVENDPPEFVVQKLIDELGKKEDCVCIIENIDDDWIQALGQADKFKLPVEFFVRHYKRTPAVQSTALSSMDDIIQSALFMERTLERRKNREPLMKIINLLLRANLVVRASVEGWGLCGVTSYEIDRVASCIAECKQLLTILGVRPTLEAGNQTNGSSNDVNSNRALRRQMRDLEFLRLRRYFNLEATVTTGDPRPFGAAEAPELDATGIKLQEMKSAKQSSLDTRVSYIRVDKHLCKFLMQTEKT
jgi:hypothetical protein